MPDNKYRMWCTATAQPVRDESYPSLPYKPIRDEVDHITKIRVAMSSKRSAMKTSECDRVHKKSRIIYHDGKEDGVICRMDRSRTLPNVFRSEIASIRCKYPNEECIWNTAVSATCNRKGDATASDLKPNSLTLRYFSLYAEFLTNSPWNVTPS
jgi:hypothetical protein